ncbi:methylaspartate mutase [Pseudomonas sp. FW215-R2]|uniref:cobalamin B12-binding domain-containing protein n=1 Tax=unclassified Pseudomonas TaxID=196821 RepID=UPI000C88513C|nr:MULTISPECIES: cobalamin-dependent protein [unclassified Pseudomonas]PMW98966.1 methylaspartate mutase [Pseudomonas sp. FW215-R2]PMX06472.1 methylaspartate mutase [Pseudomonas sp. FW215-L1]PMX24491.1 methylaspartate mutase [Pseudomonas sp. FW215-E1]PNA24352.1 methylaspartate mutase [Pseudomonas sp. FW215-R4]
MTFKQTALLTTVPSDSHSWNLVFMEFLLNDLGYKVENLGPNTPMDEVVSRLNRNGSAIVVVSTVNGHGYLEGAELARRIRAETDHSEGLYIGGKICTENDPQTIARHSETLRTAGFDEVFDDSVANSFDAFQELVTAQLYPTHYLEKRVAR